MPPGTCLQLSAHHCGTISEAPGINGTLPPAVHLKAQPTNESTHPLYQNIGLHRVIHHLQAGQISLAECTVNVVSIPANNSRASTVTKPTSHTSQPTDSGAALVECRTYRIVRATMPQCSCCTPATRTTPRVENANSDIPWSLSPAEMLFQKLLGSGSLKALSFEPLPPQCLKPISALPSGHPVGGHSFTATTAAIVTAGASTRAAMAPAMGTAAVGSGHPSLIR